MVDLLSEDFEVTHCQDPRNVMPTLQAKSFACLLTDLAMPHMSGKQVVASVKASYPNLPILVMSGRIASDPEVKAVLELGCIGVLTKPLPNPQEIVDAIKKAIATR